MSYDRCIAAVLLALATTACASTTSTTSATGPVANVSATAFPEFAQPTIPASLMRYPVAAAGVGRGWRLLGSGDLDSAEREFRAALQPWAASRAVRTLDAQLAALA